MLNNTSLYVWNGDRVLNPYKIKCWCLQILLNAPAQWRVLSQFEARLQYFI